MTKSFNFVKKTVIFTSLKITASGIAPSDNILSEIRDFPTPKDITGARSWFGLVNQVTWAHSLSDVMKPFQDLIKPNNKVIRTPELDKLFTDTKTILISMVQQGINSFDTTRRTCIQCNWSKDGIGYVVLQQYCQCPTAIASTCCPEGWHLVFGGSRSTSPTESRYAPTEGEALAVSWRLNNARMFALGCKDLILLQIKPLLKIFNHRDVSTITNPRLFKLKEKTLQ